jgi:hypothetical protein
MALTVPNTEANAANESSKVMITIYRFNIFHSPETVESVPVSIIPNDNRLTLVKITFQNTQKYSRIRRVVLRQEGS